MLVIRLGDEFALALESGGFGLVLIDAETAMGFRAGMHVHDGVEAGGIHDGLDPAHAVVAVEGAGFGVVVEDLGELIG